MVPGIMPWIRLGAKPFNLNGVWASRNIGFQPVRRADLLSATTKFSRLQARWPHRLKAYVPQRH
jgi:hypothetical protein